MATDFEAIGSALYSALGGTAGTVFYGLAPQGSGGAAVQPPYVLVNRQSAQDEYTFDNAGLNSEYVIKAVTDAYWPGPAYTRYATAHGSVQDAALTVTGYDALRCRRVSTLEYRDRDGYWHVGGVYRIDIWGTA